MDQKILTTRLFFLATPLLVAITIFHTNDN